MIDTSAQLTLPVEAAPANTLHHLIVTLEPLTDDEAAEYATASDDERADWDRARRTANVECPGMTSACEGWIECDKEHDDEELEETGESHGVEHQSFHFGWAVATGGCSLLEFSDAWCDSAYDLAEELGVGRHPIDFDWDDEYCILLSAVKQSTVAGA
jgi:hypothetical protein